MKKHRTTGWLLFSATTLLATLPLFSVLVAGQPQAPAWPEVKTENLPGARWWWMGSAVDKENLTWNMQSLRGAGIGSVEITPIYGVQGNEAREIDYLSPRWMEMLRHVQQEAGRLGMLVDMNGGTGWPFGGPDITPQYAASKQFVQQYEITAKNLAKKGRYPVYESVEIPIEIQDSRQKGISQLSTLLFVREDGYRDVIPMSYVKDGVLRFAPSQNGRLYVLFTGKTRQQVKRSAPGGEGLVMNHLSKEALAHYLERFDKAFEESGTAWPHTFFNDSYEVYGADWSENLLDEFKARRGYDLAKYLPEFCGQGDPQTIAKVVCDYRQTISDMLLHNFTLPWTEWAHSHGVTTRNQAHGSPGNLLDLYAAMDIPECESFGCTQFDLPGLRVDKDIRRNDAVPATLRYASSAAHVAGKPLTSSESMTWLTEHFRTSLALIKPEMDLLFVNGVNRVFYHGSTYTPKDAPWPGWLFYASIMVNPNNSIFRDMSALNTYITRVQSFLQQGSPDNELLLYFPIFDIWEKYRKGNYVAFEIHKLEDKLPHFEQTVDEILRLGYDLDYISDSQLQQTAFRDGSLQTPGGSYRSILVPDCQVMPLETLQQLLSLARQGARVMFLGQLPDAVPGLFQADERKAAMMRLWQEAGLNGEDGSLQIHPYGKGCLMRAASLEALLAKAGLSRESLSADHGARLIRRRLSDGSVYFVSMLQNRSIDGWVALGHEFADLHVFNPMTGESGRALTRTENGQKQVYLQLQPGESVILRCYDQAVAEAPVYPAFEKAFLKGRQAVRYGEGFPLEGKWQFEFTEGAPAIKGRFSMAGQPIDWTRLPADSAKAYAGAGRYTLSLKMPRVPDADDWCLDFGDGLYESARVYVNGQDAGRVWALPYRINVGRFLKAGKKNLIEIEVTNMPANRIADYDRRGVNWRIFKDINVVSVFYKPITFDVWETVPGGLTETPRLMPLRTIYN